jgi:NAD(P)H dehydrogenase (quinone)
VTKLLVLFHSFYGDVYRLAEAVREGATSASAEVSMKQVPEIVPQHALESSGAAEAKKAFAHVETATVDELPDYDGIALGCGTRFGNQTASMRSFLEQTGQIWLQGKLINKAAMSFVGTGTGSGREATIISSWFTFAHHGMIIVPLGYREMELRSAADIHGASPYGAGVMQRAEPPRPSQLELSLARAHGKAWAEVAARLVGL